ncbi:MAG: Holliday junction resolvase RuvX [Candidatus Eremiobacteraeota bacterium]|nr:Holliday junction resolvase RuvX [Candidatus Eremiobacteraeota bacterium]
MAAHYRRIMGIDVGSKRIGIAFSDPLCIIASPWGFIEVQDTAQVIEKLGALISEYSVGEIVVGLPKNMDGSLGPQALISQELASALEKEYALKVHLVDERLTSWEAEGLLIDAGVRRKSRKGKTDKIAASLILKEYLDSRKKTEDDAPCEDTEAP